MVKACTEIGEGGQKTFGDPFNSTSLYVYVRLFDKDNNVLTGFTLGQGSTRDVSDYPNATQIMVSVDASQISRSIYKDEELVTVGNYVITESIDLEYSCAHWDFASDGFPRSDEATTPVPNYTTPIPKAQWRVNSAYNDGFLYNELLPNIPYVPPVPPVEQKPYITVYSYQTPQTGFDTHGLFVLTPTKCTIVEELNGRYELSIEHSIDPEGRWEYIRENNLIKALGQLFTIRSVTQKWQGNVGKITAKADHIFYQLGDWWITKETNGITGRTAYALIHKAVENTVKELRPGQTSYTFTYSTDLAVPQVLGDNKWAFLTEGLTPIDFIMGNSGIIEVCGGELHRDNFSFSLYETKEGSKDNAFEIRVGKNLTGVTRTIDTSSMTTYLRAWNNWGDFYAVSWAGTEGFGMPHYTIREKSFQYDLVDLYGRDEHELAYQMLVADTNAYFEAYCAPLISYDIDLADIKNNPEYEGLTGFDEFKVGNKGYIYDERLGGKIHIKITETTTDALTGEVTNVVFGSKRNFMNPLNKTAILDIETEVETMGFQITDADGAFVLDAEGSMIVEYEGV